MSESKKLREVWEWKDIVYEKTKNMSTKERLEFIRIITLYSVQWRNQPYKTSGSGYKPAMGLMNGSETQHQPFVAFNNPLGFVSQLNLPG